jgi:adenosylhomocysteine nucleosidase
MIGNCPIVDCNAMDSATLVFFALSQEAAPFRKQLPRNSSCRLVISGIGPSNAQQAAERALLAGRPSMVYTCGFAGALNPALEQHAVLFEAPPSFPDYSLLVRLGAVPSKYCLSARIVSSVAEKQQLRSATHADAVEMESGIIHRLCAERGISCATVRVISDTAAENLPLDFNQFMTQHAGMNYAKLAVALARSPRKLGELLAFQGRLKQSARVLGSFLKRLLDAGECPGQS